MELQVGQAVITSDDVKVGKIIEVELNREGKQAGIIVERWDRAGESRFPIAWITGITNLGVHLIVSAAEITPGGSDVLFDDEGQIVRW